MKIGTLCTQNMHCVVPENIPPLWKFQLSFVYFCKWAKWKFQLGSEAKGDKRKEITSRMRDK